MESPARRKDLSIDLLNKTDRTDYDMPEIAMGINQYFGHSSKSTDLGTTTFGEVTFRRVDPLRDPFQVADARLQSRLESLCESLRAKY
jgi:hypothetical protein